MAFFNLAFHSFDTKGPSLKPIISQRLNDHLISRDRLRFFLQAGHETTYASIGNKHFFT